MIALAVGAVPLAGLAAKPAVAGDVAAEQAVAILTRARIADSRCNFLPGPLREELSRYTARAEIAAAGQISVAATRRAAAAGAAQGRAAACDAATRADIEETLSAAREAVRAADSEQRRKTAVSDPQDQSGNTAGHAANAGSGTLSEYARLVELYYVERKCRHLSAKQDIRYWKAIGRLHRATVEANGAAVVAPLMKRAERNANRRVCGEETLLLVKSGFGDTVRR